MALAARRLVAALLVALLLQQSAGTAPAAALYRPLRLQCQCNDDADAAGPRIVAVTAWRGLNHSYAVIGSHVLATLIAPATRAAHGNFELAVLDAPLYSTGWNAQRDMSAPVLAGTVEYAYDVTVYRDTGGILRPPEYEGVTEHHDAHVPAPGSVVATTCPDIQLRIQFPLDLSPPQCAHTVVYTYGTTESGIPADDAFAFQRGAWRRLGSRHFLATPSSWSAQGFRDVGVAADRIMLWPNGVDAWGLFRPLQPADKAAARRRLQWTRQSESTVEDDFVFLSIGHMRQNKGIAFAMYGAYHAAAWLQQARMAGGNASVAAAVAASGGANIVPPGDEVHLDDVAAERHLPHAVRLRLKGNDAMYASRGEVDASLQQLRRVLARMDGSHTASLDALLQNKSLVIEYTGDDVSDEQLAALYQAADAYVSPYMYEGFNMPVLEALACGTPVIVTAGGPTDEFTSAACARQVPAQLQRAKRQRMLVPDLEAVAQAMIDVIRDDGWRRHAAVAARTLVVEQKALDWGNITTRWLQHAMETVRDCTLNGLC